MHLCSLFKWLLSIINLCLISTSLYAASNSENLSTPPAKKDFEAAVTTNVPSSLDKDPYEGFNRAMFKFNDVLDIYLLKPVAQFYNAIMPKPLNEGIHNVFSNLGELTTIANDLLQLHFYQFANDSWRLAINSTVGIGGLFDVATRINLPYYSNDFGLTMAYYGYKNSNYLVLPLFGPNTVRDGLGLPVDYYLFSAYQFIHPDKTRYALFGLNIIDQRAQLLQYQSVMDEAIIDKYSFMRNAYMQRRAYEIKQNAELHNIVGQTRNDSPAQNYNKIGT